MVSTEHLWDGFFLKARPVFHFKSKLFFLRTRIARMLEDNLSNESKIRNFFLSFFFKFFFFFCVDEDSYMQETSRLLRSANRAGPKETKARAYSGRTTPQKTPEGHCGAYIPTLYGVLDAQFGSRDPLACWLTSIQSSRELPSYRLSGTKSK